jgi:hypothetical protein
LGLVLITTISLFLVRPPSPDPDHPFDTEAAFARLSRILGDERPHPIDTDANDGVRERLVAEIENLGFDPIVRDAFHCTDHFGGVCARVRNVMFWAVPPTDKAEKGVALMSHYDSVPAGPGASDDGAGVAVGLEVARIIQDRDLPRPVLILMTDGEETGLLGAESFVQNDPIADQIGAVVNIEARGVRGPVSMFQTSSPNSNDIAAVTRWGRTALTNSLSSDIYEAMPNDTDLSRFLDNDAPRTIDATNYAFILGESFYHTPGDNLENLDRGSLFHTGMNALSSVEHFALQNDTDSAESQRLYFDLSTRGVIIWPIWAGLVTLTLAGLINLIALFRQSAWRDWKGWLVVPFALLGAGALGFGAGWVIDLLREGGAYSPASPWALRGATSAVAILTALIICLVLTSKPRSEDDVSALLKSWIWLALIALIGWLVFPGSIVIFAGSLAVAAFAGIAALFGYPKLCRALSLIAAAFFMLINLSLAGFAMAALGGLATPIASLWAIPVIILLTAYPIRRFVILPVGSVGVATLGLIIAAILVPTHTAKAPYGLSVYHIGAETGNFLQITGRTPPPDAFTKSGSFTFDNPTETRIPRYSGPAWSRSIANEPDVPVNLELLSDESDGSERTVRLQITAPMADRLHLAPASTDALWTALSVNDVAVKPSAWGLRIAGRTAQNVTIDIGLPADKPLGDLAVIRYGLEGAAKALADQRPDWSLQQHDGDLQIRFVTLDNAEQAAPILDTGEDADDRVSSDEDNKEE